MEFQTHFCNSVSVLFLDTKIIQIKKHIEDNINPVSSLKIITNKKECNVRQRINLTIIILFQVQGKWRQEFLNQKSLEQLNEIFNIFPNPVGNRQHLNIYIQLQFLLDFVITNNKKLLENEISDNLKTALIKPPNKKKKRTISIINITANIIVKKL